MSSENSNKKNLKRIGRTSIEAIEVRPLKDQVFQLLSENPYLSTRMLCKKLGISYKKRRRTVWQYRYEWRNLLKFGAAPISPNVPHKRIFVGSVDNVVWGRDRALGCSWKPTRAKNRMIQFPSDSLSYLTELGYVQWHENGTVVMHLSGEVNKGRAAQLWSNAFLSSGLVDDIVTVHGKFQEVWNDERFRHWVFPVGDKVPGFKIDKFRKSHGLTIKGGDLSHPDAVEVEEEVPLGVASRIDAIIDVVREESGYLIQGQVPMSQALQMLVPVIKEIYEKTAKKNVEPDFAVILEGETLHLEGGKVQKAG